jgi:signal transduction histidine kinase
LLNGKALINFQNRYVSKTGKILWLDWTSIYLTDKEIVFAIAKDVTERKKEEWEIEEKYKKFKSLAAHFKTSIEKERKFLAIELHEELAQLAAVVKMDIEWIGKNVEGLNPDSKKRFDHAIGVSQLLINAIRRISYSISPQMLEDLGFNETLKWLCEEFSILNGIQCSFESSVDDGVLNREIQLDFFRICQEALSNIMYHAQANQVTISIKTEGDAVLLCITDDGKGFDLINTKPAHGLTSIRERASSINALLNIDSATGKGTRICITISHNIHFPN